MDQISDTALVIAPARPMTLNGEGGVLFESKRLGNGERIGVAFTNVEMLVEAMGNSQPWVCVPLLVLKEFHAAADVHQLVVNPRFQYLPKEGS